MLICSRKGVQRCWHSVTEEIRRMVSLATYATRGLLLSLNSSSSFWLTNAGSCCFRAFYILSNCCEYRSAVIFCLLVAPLGGATTSSVDTLHDIPSVYWWACCVRQSISWGKPMADTLGNVISDRRFIAEKAIINMLLLVVAYWLPTVRKVPSGWNGIPQIYRHLKRTFTYWTILPTRSKSGKNFFVSLWKRVVLFYRVCSTVANMKILYVDALFKSINSCFFFFIWIW